MACGRTGDLAVIVSLIAGAVAGGPPHEAAWASETVQSWCHDLNASASSLPNILPTPDGGLIVIGRGDVSIDTGTSTHFGKPAGAFVASFTAGGDTRYVVPLLMPHSLVYAESLDPSGDLYLTGTAWEGERRQYVWTSRVEATTGRVAWFRQYPCVDASFSSLYPTGRGGLIVIAEVSGGLRIGNKTLSVPPELVEYSFTPATQFLVVLDEQGNLTFSEELDKRRHVLYPGRDRVFVAAQRGEDSDYAETVEARAYDGRLLWRRSLDRAGYLASDSDGNLVQFAYRHPDCRDPKIRCSPSWMERILIDGDGHMSSAPMPEFGKGPAPNPIQRPAPVGWKRPIAERTAESPAWIVDPLGRSLVLSRDTDFAVSDERGRLINHTVCCARSPGDNSEFGTTAAWAADGAVFTAHLAEHSNVLRVAKWPLDQQAAAPVVQARSAGTMTTGCPESMAYIPPWVLPLPRRKRPSIDPAAHPYCIDVLETNQAEYAECVKARKCTPIKPTLSWRGQPKYPVTGAASAQADAYCRFRKRRLPTSSEWIRAAIGDDGVADPWKRHFSLRNAFGVCYGKQPCEVGRSDFDKSPFGVRDMEANAQEWFCDQDPERHCDIRGDRWDSATWKREGAGIRCALDASE